MDSLIKAIATALDIVEGELLGASPNHGKRIAVLCARMGRALGKSPEEIASLAICAMLHDNALTHDPATKGHCEHGQRNVDALHLKADASNFVLYHHERADGSGPFGVREGEGPLGAELIAIADSIDVAHHLQRLEPKDLPRIRGIISEEAGKRWSAAASKAMLDVLDEPLLLSLRDCAVAQTAAEAIPPWIVGIDDASVSGFADFISKVIDCKSAFTRLHSSQIADKAWLMGGYYKYDSAERKKLRLAAALHDIGKLATPSDILEKPGKLTDEEFSIIKDHVRVTWELLKDIEGFDDICAWASNHHEKLDGSGYPFGKKADELDFNSRLMTCIDVYQAVSEERPYHPGRSHEDTMKILYDMAEKGKADMAIAKDMDIAFSSGKAYE